MSLKEKIDTGMKIFVLILLGLLLSVPFFYIHNEVVNVLAELAAKTTKYLFGVK